MKKNLLLTALLLSSLTITSNANAEERVFVDTGETVTLQDKTYTNNVFSGYGAAVLNKGDVTIQNSSFTNTESQMGAVYNQNIMKVDNSTFTGNNGTDYAGGITAYFMKSLEINNSTFDNNTTDMYSSAGAVYVSGNTKTDYATITNSIFRNNNTIRQDGYGTAGAIGLGFGQLNISNTTFTNNKSNGGGAILVFAPSGSETLEDRTLIISNNSVFDGNYATSYGGAIANTSTTNISNTTFSNNIADEFGGAIYNEGVIDVKATTFTNNSTEYYGGAIYNYGTLNVEETTFENNTAELGGAIYNEGTLTIGDNVTFKNNHGTVHGSDIYNDGGTVTIGDNLVISRDAMQTSVHDCSIYTKNGDITIGNNATFQNLLDGIVIETESDVTIGNNALFSGNFSSIDNFAANNTITIGENAIFENGIARSITIEDSATNSVVKVGNNAIFRNYNNEASSALSFGTIYNGKGNSTIQFLGTSEFSNNSTPNDNAGVFQNWSNLIFDGKATFTNNSANGDGGAIRNRGAASVTTFNDVAEFTGNTAANNGGAIYNQGEITIADNSTFENNTAKLGGAIYNEGTVNIGNNVTFKNNHGTAHGSEIYNNGGTITIGDNLLISRDAQQTSVHDCAIYTRNGDITIGDNATFQNLLEGIITETNTNVTIGDNATFTGNYDAIENFAANNVISIGENAVFENGLSRTLVNDDAAVNSIIKVGNGAIFRNNVNNNTENSFATIYNGEGTTMQFLGTSEFTNNSAPNGNAGVFQNFKGNLIFDGKATFTGNSANGDGAALRNRGASSVATFNDSVEFTNNTAGRNGGAILNEGTVNLKNATFSGNKAGEELNDIYNTGTVNFDGTSTLDGGITGAGTTVVKANAVVDASAGKLEQTTVNNLGELKVDVTKVNVTNGIQNEGVVTLSGEGELTQSIVANTANAAINIDTASVITMNQDTSNIINVTNGTLALGSTADAALYDRTINVVNGATLDIANGTINNLSDIGVAADETINLAIDFEDTINVNSSNLVGDIEISKIDVTQIGTTASSTLTTTNAENINLAANFEIYRGSDLENTANYVTMTKTGTTAVLNATQSSLRDAIADTADERVYTKTQDETIVADTVVGNLLITGSGQTISSDANDVGGGIQVGEYGNDESGLKITDVNVSGIKVNEDNKGAITVVGENALAIEAKNNDVTIENTVGGSVNNAIYLDGTDAENAEAILIANEDRQIIIKDDIRSNNENNVLELTGDGDIHLHGVLDPLTVNMSAANVYRYNNDENILWNLNAGTLHYTNDLYLSNLGNSMNFNGGTLNLMNGATNNVVLDDLSVSANSNIMVDVNAATQQMDTLTATTYNTVAANLNVSGMNIYGTPVANEFETTFVDDSTLGNGALLGHVTSSVNEVETGIYKYNVSYVDDGTTGKFKYNVAVGPKPYNSYNPNIFSSSVAMQGAYLSQLSNYDTAFGNLDQTMLMTQEQRKALKYGNKYAANDETNPQVYSPLFSQNENNGIWFRPYASFEQVKLSGGPDVNNVMYGSLVGGDSEIVELGNGWEGQVSVYAGYNGSHQTYEGVGIYQNGGIVGATTAFYKNNFFTALTASVGAHVADIKSNVGNNDLTMLTAGIASKTGYNWELLNGKMIVQPSWMMSYTFLNPFDNYTMANGVRLENSALNAIQLVPGLKVIGNLKNGWQPYLGINMRWNLIDDTKVKANYVNVPETSVDPYFEYGLGLQKLVGDRFTGFGQAMFRGGSRAGVAFTFGFRWALGDLKDKHQKK